MGVGQVRGHALEAVAAMTRLRRKRAGKQGFSSIRRICNYEEELNGRSDLREGPLGLRLAAFLIERSGGSQEETEKFWKPWCR